MNEAEAQALATWQAKQVVNHLRAAGWVFAAIVLWTRKDEGGLAGASYFDLPKSETGAMPRLADAVRMVATEMDRSFKAIGAREWDGDHWLHTLGGTGVDAQAKRARELAEAHDQLLLEVSSYRSGMMAAESRLAEATALLVCCTGERADGTPIVTQDLAEEICAFLAGQHSAPTDRLTAAAERAYAKAETGEHWKALSARTEAEQRVLDAMGEVPESNVRVIVNGSVNLRGLPKAFAAELARRGLEP